MSVKIRLKRMGFRKRPYYRIVVMDSKTGRDGKSIEELGYYHPLEAKKELKLDAQKTERWLSCGAKMTDTVRSLYKRVKADPQGEGIVSSSSPIIQEVPLAL